MSYEANTLLLTSTWETASGQTAWVDTGNGTPKRGINVKFQVQNVVGNPDVLFVLQTSNDQVSVFEVSKNESGPVNTVGEYNLHLVAKNRYWRAAWLFNANDTSEGSLNSSSLSSQSFNSSSSGGSSPAVQLTIGQTIASLG